MRRCLLACAKTVERFISSGSPLKNQPGLQPWVTTLKARCIIEGLIPSVKLGYKEASLSGRESHRRYEVKQSGTASILSRGVMWRRGWGALNVPAKGSCAAPSTSRPKPVAPVSTREALSWRNLLKPCRAPQVGFSRRLTGCQRLDQRPAHHSQDVHDLTPASQVMPARVGERDVKTGGMSGVRRTRLVGAVADGHHYIEVPGIGEVVERLRTMATEVDVNFLHHLHRLRFDARLLGAGGADLEVYSCLSA